MAAADSLPRSAAGTRPPLLPLVGLLAAFAGVLLSAPALALVGYVLITAGCLRRWVPPDVGVPVAVLLLVSLATLAGTGAAAVDINLLTHPNAVNGVLLLGAVAATAVAARSRHSARPGQGFVTNALWSLPAALAGLVGMAQLIDVRLTRSWTLLGTDVAAHTVLVHDVQVAGNLDYSADPYPRGLHMLLALVSARHPFGPDLVSFDLQLYSAVVWLALAALLCAAAAMTNSAAIRLGANTRAAAAMGGLTGLLILTTQSFQAAFVHMGAAPSMIAVIALWIMPAVAASALGRQRILLSVLVAASAETFLLAHLWQALVLAPGMTALVWLAAYALTARGRGKLTADWASLRASRVLIPLAGGTAVVLAAAAAPPLLRIHRAGGVGLAALPGETTLVPVVLTLVCSACFVVWAARGPRKVAVVWCGTAAGLGATLAVLMVGAGDGLSFDQYYPRKALWFLVLFASPLLVVVAAPLGRALVARAWLVLAARTRLGPLLRVSAYTCLALLAAGVLGPGLVGQGSIIRAALTEQPDNDPGVRRIEIATSAAVEHPGYVLVPSAVALARTSVQTGAYVTSKLLTFQTGRPTNYGDPMNVCADVHLVAGTQAAIVVTDLDPELMSKLLSDQGCGGVGVSRPPNTDPILVKKFVSTLRAASVAAPPRDR